MKTILLLLASFCLTAQAQLITTSTNRVTNAVPIRTQAILTPCPECGGPNHHVQQLCDMIAYNLLTVSVVVDGHTNQQSYTTGPTNRWLSTNLIFQTQTRRQPGFTSPPPMP